MAVFLSYLLCLSRSINSLRSEPLYNRVKAVLSRAGYEMMGHRSPDLCTEAAGLMWEGCCSGRACAHLGIAKGIAYGIAYRIAYRIA